MTRVASWHGPPCWRLGSRSWPDDTHLGAREGAPRPSSGDRGRSRRPATNSAARCSGYSPASRPVAHRSRGPREARIPGRLRLHCACSESKKAYKVLPPFRRPLHALDRCPSIRRRRWGSHLRWGFCRTQRRRIRPLLAFGGIPYEGLLILGCLADRDPWPSSGARQQT